MGKEEEVEIKLPSIIMAKSQDLGICWLLLVVLCTCMVAAKADVNPLVPAIFVFGDSVVDVGTNNFLNGTLAVANVPYYGIDFLNSVPTGRFSNGPNIADQLAMLFGFSESPPAYLSLLNDTSDFQNNVFTKQGVNFGSGGAGILYETGKEIFKNVVSLRDQIQQFSLVRSNITMVKGQKETAKFLAKSLFIFSVGSNDLLDHQRLGSTTPKEKLIDEIQSTYRCHLKNMYNMGARRFGIVGVSPIGCCPYARANYSARTGRTGCDKEMNDFAKAFYASVDVLLKNMTSEFPEMKYSLGNMYKMTKDVFAYHKFLGFEEIKKACCGGGYLNGRVPCYESYNVTLCPNRKEYLFWDMYHPSSNATLLAAENLFGGEIRYMKPMNFSMLVEV